MTSRRRLQENIAALATLQVFGYIAPLFTVPYLVRVLKPGQFGLLSLGQGVALYFDLLTDYGFNLSATRAIAGERKDPFAVARIFWSTLWAKLMLMFASAAILSLLLVSVPKLRAQPGLYAASFLYVVGTALFPVWLLQGLERMKTAAVALGIARTLTIPALFIFVRSEHDTVRAAAIQASVQVTAAILVLPQLLTRMSLTWYRPSLDDLVQTFKGGWALFVSGSALYLSTSSTTVVLGFAAGQAEVGYYSAADKLVKAVISLLAPVTQALFPHITAVKATSNISAIQLIRKSLFSTAALSLLASLGALLLSRPVCQLVLGHSFHESVYVMRWLSPLPFLFGLMSVLGTQTMLVFDLDAAMSRIMFCSALAGTPLILGLSMSFGARGAAAGSSAVACAMVIAMVTVLRVRGLAVWRLRSAEAYSSLL